MSKKASILVVDDDLGMRETLPDILEDAGYEVAVAKDAHEAIEMVKNHSFDVILMDIKMPGINGVEAFKEIKRVKPASRVIMMTAYSVDDLVKESLKQGAQGVFYKPLNINALVQAINSD